MADSTSAARTSAVDRDVPVRPFRIEFPEEELAELRRRVKATRWPDSETVMDDSQGVPLALMQELVRYWGQSTTGANVSGD